MELEIDSTVGFFDIDLIIRRTIQDHFMNMQPHAGIWQRIQRRVKKQQKTRLTPLIRHEDHHITEEK